ncbi:carboxylate-amine ligase [Tranquillimonas alkanivorans]|uniref:Putative glutamate--cysteine ligase 2 n=1 Tax=Tranquillimonas alkanivorans TaxID=441119 RepID=A0A1I5REH3_9RHOB|nr:carboxylate-amine ligase [Tranquillimonas alkanivorans]SFP56929.1 carboxylate-amine ligase [Tranquillimonas alkanivorans]
MGTPDFTIGIEEEYLLADATTLDLADAPEALIATCKERLEDRVSPEFLQCQVEVGTSVCRTVAEAREDLAHLRRTVAEVAGDHGLVPLAVSCHPWGDWKAQHHRDRERYNDLRRDLGGVARRMLICGMHVHVGLNDDELRLDLMNQLTYFLPHLLALSCSSPFWQGEDTGLESYRLAVFDNLPRTGLPPRFASWAEYQRSVQLLIDTKLIEDSTKIWWDLRPSHTFPTLETRICDVSPRLDHAASIAALIQCVTRTLWRLRGQNLRWRIYERFLLGENRWRAQRYGPSEGLIDFGRGEIVPFADLLEEFIALVHEDAMELGCVREVDAARDILVTGTSAARQRAVFAEATGAGAEPREALREVARHLSAEYHHGL